MGYSALLFCPDDKTARTVTLVLSDLEFTVEACSEPFAAVKKLMGQHFDAVVVDCDNEQNATLLFKSARNSTSNQTSLAVAVVEGQAGVAKAFRIGANLVLTKPINIEQSKGTLRVARGLLRKGEPGKPAAGTPAPNTISPASKPAVAKAATEVKPAAPVVAPLTAEAGPAPVIKPTPAWPAAALASAAAPAQDEDLLGIDSEETNKAAGTKTDSRVAMNLFSADLPTAQKGSATGAASAAAPAREPAVVEPAKTPATAPSIPEKPVEAVATAPAAVVGSAPSFTFGGNVEAEPESSGGSKKVILGIAAAVIVAAGLYAGVTHFRGAASEPTKTDDAPASAPPSSARPPASTSTPSTPAEKPSATPAPGSQASHSEPNKIQSIIDEAARDTHSTKESGNDKTSSDSGSETAEPEPLLVKGGKIAKKPKAVADAPAPSMIGMSTPDADAPPVDLIPSTTPTLRPTLSTVHVSQGVSTGLLIKKVAPVYPGNALRMQVEGNVELLATISKDGNITNIKVLSGDGQLAKAATDAVKQWKYKPYLLNGEPVEIQTQVTVKFKLPR